MTQEQIKREINNIWEYLAITPSENPEELKERLNTLSTYFSWVNYHIAPAKRRYMEAKRSGLMTIAGDAEAMKLSKTMQNELVDTICGEQFEDWDTLVRLDRALSKEMATCTSVLSYIKTEMEVSKYQTH